MIQEKFYLKGHEEAAWALTCQDGLLWSGSLDGTIRHWDPLNEIPLLSQTTVSPGKIYSLASILNGTKLAIGTSEKKIHIFNIKKKSIDGVLEGHNGTIYSLMPWQDEKLISQCDDTTIKLWSTQSEQAILEVKGTTNYVSTIALQGINMISETLQGTIGIWSLQNGQQVSELPGHHEGKSLMDRHMRTLCMVGNTLVSGSNTFSIKLWDLKSQNQIAHLKSHKNYVNIIEPLTEKQFASVSGDRTIKLWDLRMLNVIETKKTSHSNWIQGLAVMKKEDGSHLLFTGSGDSSIGVFSLKTAQLEIPFSNQNLNASEETKGDQISATLIQQGITTPLNSCYQIFQALPSSMVLEEKEQFNPCPGYDFIKDLGLGGFGGVSQVRRNGQINEYYAIKAVQGASGPFKKAIDDEISILKKIDSPYCIRYIDSYFIPRLNLTGIVEEFATGGNLRTEINERNKKGEKFSNLEIACFIEEISSGLAHLHDLNIVHRDLKPENILLSADKKHYKLCDFGLSKLVENIKEQHHTTNQGGTISYYAPEILSHKEFTYKSDIYTFGIVIREMCNLKSNCHEVPKDYQLIIAEIVEEMTKFIPHSRPDSKTINFKIKEWIVGRKN